MSLRFGDLVQSIQVAHRELQARALQAVNVGLTLRNALIGYYLAEYQLAGKDRAEYGDRVVDRVAAELAARKVPNTSRRQLYRYLEFHRLYPSFVGALSAQFPEISQRLLLPQNVGTPSAHSLDPALLLTRLSYSHFEELLDCKDELQRLFYEVHCLQGNWSVRELKRQMGTLLFERSALSKDKKALLSLVQSHAESQQALHHIRDPYLFEFVGLKAQDVFTESDLENALIARLEEFLLELGHGFCFEARQKRILIGGEHFFVDLVFYHRILKCHVLIELKNDQFRHEHLGQLNSYVSYFEKNEKIEGDNPPVGILLCTRKNQELVEYALAGMSNQLFVSRYQVELPAKEKLQQFVHQVIVEMDDQAAQEQSASSQGEAST